MPVVCATYRPLEHPVLFWNLFLMCLPFSWIWVRGGQELCVNSLDQQFRARYLTYGIRVNLVKWVCTHNSHSSSSTPSQTLPYSCSEMYLHFRLIKGCKDLTLSLSHALLSYVRKILCSWALFEFWYIASHFIICYTTSIDGNNRTTKDYLKIWHPIGTW